MAATYLFVGAYARRSDNATVRVYRINGTQDYIVNINNIRVPGRFTRRAAIAHARA